MTIFAVAVKELTLYFTSLLFYALATVFLVLAGYLFYTNLDFYVRFGGMNLVLGLWQYQFHDMRQLLLVLVPLLTMRLFAEERRLGTLELLWTYPIRDIELVAGKFLACLVVLAAIILPTLAYPLLLDRFQPVSWGQLYATVEYVTQHQPLLEALTTLVDHPPTRTEDVADVLREANDGILRSQERYPEQRGMGTTVAGLTVVDAGGREHWVVFNIGDSRVYRLADNRMSMVTRDHSEVRDWGMRA